MLMLLPRLLITHLPLVQVSLTGLTPVSLLQAPDLKSMEAHHDSKHSKMGAFNPQQCIDAHAAAGGVTTQGVAVRGSQKVRHK